MPPKPAGATDTAAWKRIAIPSVVRLNCTHCHVVQTTYIRHTHCTVPPQRPGKHIKNIRCGLKPAYHFSPPCQPPYPSPCLCPPLTRRPSPPHNHNQRQHYYPSWTQTHNGLPPKTKNSGGILPRISTVLRPRMAIAVAAVALTPTGVARRGSSVVVFADPFFSVFHVALDVQSETIHGLRPPCRSL